MSVKTLTDNLKHRASQARTLHVEPVIESSQGLVTTGLDTLKSAGTVVADSVGKIVQVQVAAGKAVAEAARAAKAETVATLSHAGEELRATLKDGYQMAGDKLSRFGSPSRKLQAEAHKAEVKAKKAARRKVAA